MLVMNNKVFREVLLTWIPYPSIRYWCLKVSPSTPVLPMCRVNRLGSTTNSSIRQASSIAAMPSRSGMGRWGSRICSGIRSRVVSTRKYFLSSGWRATFWATIGPGNLPLDSS